MQNDPVKGIVLKGKMVIRSRFHFGSGGGSGRGPRPQGTENAGLSMQSGVFGLYTAA